VVKFVDELRGESLVVRVALIVVGVRVMMVLWVLVLGWQVLDLGWQGTLFPRPR